VSRKLESQIWREIKISGAKKIVLLALAACAWDDGSNVYPSVDYLVWIADVSRAQVHRILATFRSMRVLIPIEHQSGGRGRFAVYRLDLSVLDRKQAFKRKPYIRPNEETRDYDGAANETYCAGMENGFPETLHSDEKNRPIVRREGSPHEKKGSHSTDAYKEDQLEIYKRSKPSRSATRAERADGDPRHHELRESIKRLQRETIRFEIWDGRAAKKLAELLAGSTATAEQLQEALVWWGMSPDEPRAKHPGEWLGGLSAFLDGPLDRYGRPIPFPPEGWNPEDNPVEECFDQLLAIVQGRERKPNGRTLRGLDFKNVIRREPSDKFERAARSQEKQLAVIDMVFQRRRQRRMAEDEDENRAGLLPSAGSSGGDS
jgi:hypothetical protein